MSKLLLLVCLVAFVSADVYLHNPRGSNNRLDDENRDRNNANRLFDSQNNNRGGNNVGNLYYYSGSKLSFSWTNQHSCGDVNANCEIIIQYMCDDRLRDGTDQNTIPVNPRDCYNFNCDTDVRFGRQESFQSYQDCRNTERNKGLFLANQKLNGNSAQYTRQNPNGARRGYECPEERDYYPYWRPSEWKDLYILTNDPTRCASYVAESFNVKGRWICDVNNTYETTTMNQNGWWNGPQGFIPITREACENLSLTTSGLNAQPVWRYVPPNGAPAPQCGQAPWSRENQLGNGLGGYPNQIDITIPDLSATQANSPQCAFRLRYNISTGEYEGFASAFSVQVGDVNASLNGVNVRDTARDPARLPIWEKYGLTYDQNDDCFNQTINQNDAGRVNCREYVFQDNPKVDIFGSLIRTTTTPPGKVKLQLAINTDQFGRTFQDRSHRFFVRNCANGPHGCADLLNINVQGKRGNIVQTFPGTEYDFFPYQPSIRPSSWVHIQWTGSNTNPNNNAGQGRQGSDRHNIVLLQAAKYFEGQNFKSDFGVPRFGQLGLSYPQPIPVSGGRDDCPESDPACLWNARAFLGLSRCELQSLATAQDMCQNNRQGGHLGGELSELDDASTYFDMGPRRVSTTLGSYYYMCSRNNNFSNRGQKSVIHVSGTQTASAFFGSAAQTFTFNGATVAVQDNAFTSVSTVKVTMTDSKGSGVDAASDLLHVGPTNLALASGASMQVSLNFNNNPLGSATLYRADTQQGPWKEYTADRWAGDVVYFSITKGGVFTVKDPNNIGAIVGVVIAVVIVLAAIAFAVYKLRKGSSSQSTTVTKSAVTAGGSRPAAPPAQVVSVGSGTPAPLSSSSTERQLPAGWIAMVDPQDNAVYYVNPQQGTSQWEFPEA